MRKIGSFLLGIGVLCILGACNEGSIKGSGAKSTMKLNVADFNDIDVSANMKVIVNVVEGVTPTAEITGYSNLLQHIKYAINKRKLEVNTDLGENNNFALKDETTLNVTVPTLEGLSVDGKSKGEVHGNLKSNLFMLDISGASTVTIDNLDVTYFSTVIAGAADLEVRNGKADSTNFQLSGAGKIKTFPLIANSSVVSISGAAVVELNALKQLTVDISGAGSVLYKGTPQITKSISGAGTIKQSN